jgi:hypothetical protein
VSDLTADEQANVRAAIRVLYGRAGGWAQLAKALGFKLSTVNRAHRGNDDVTPRMAFRVARMAGVGVDEVLAGRWPVAGTCPHCGQRVPRQIPDTSLPAAESVRSR